MPNPVPTPEDYRKVGALSNLLLGQFGGPEGFAKEFVSEYCAAKPESAVRRKMIEAVLKLLESVHGNAS